MKPLTPKKLVQKYHGTAWKQLLTIDEIVFLMKAYHGQFEDKKNGPDKTA